LDRETLMKNRMTSKSKMAMKAKMPDSSTTKAGAKPVGKKTKTPKPMKG
jgi:hypothetical protein